MRVKRVLAGAVLLCGLGVVPVWAQHGGSRGSGGGGASSHAAAPSFHGSFASAGRPNFAAAPRYAGSGYAPRVATAYQGRAYSATGVPYVRSGGGHDPHGYGNRWRGGYAVAPWVGVSGWAGPGYLGYGDSYVDAAGGDDSSPDGQADVDGQAYGPQPYYGEQPGYDSSSGPSQEQPYQVAAAPYPGDAPYPEAAPTPAPRVVAAEPPPPAEDAVTIVFKDGRAPLQIHNYALTPTMLYVTDARHRDIPLADIDLAATDKANREAGVSFTVPVTR